jgi:hypothetical protein
MSPKKLTDTQLVLLSAASQRKHGSLELTGNPKGSVARKTITKLLKDGLVEEVPAGGMLPVWRRDDDEGGIRAAYHRVRPCCYRHREVQCVTGGGGRLRCERGGREYPRTSTGRCFKTARRGQGASVGHRGRAPWLS